MNDLKLCLEVVSRSCQPLCYIRRWISRKPLEIEAWFQRTTNRKRHMAYQMVTWPMTSRDPKGAVRQYGKHIRVNIHNFRDRLRLQSGLKSLKCRATLFELMIEWTEFYGKLRVVSRRSDLLATGKITDECCAYVERREDDVDAYCRLRSLFRW